MIVVLVSRARPPGGRRRRGFLEESLRLIDLTSLGIDSFPEALVIYRAMMAFRDETRAEAPNANPTVVGRVATGVSTEPLPVCWAPDAAEDGGRQSPFEPRCGGGG